MKAVRTIYNVFSVILVIAIVVVMLLAVLLGISGINKENPWSFAGFRAFTVDSGSMSPAFGEGSVIFTQEIDAGAFKLDDVITYKPKDFDPKNPSILTHRIVSVHESEADCERFHEEHANYECGKDNGYRHFITAGDYTKTLDPNPVNPGWILGKVVFSVNGLGTFIQFLQTPWGIAGMIAVIAAGLFVIPYFLAPKEINEKTKKTVETTDAENGTLEDIITDKDGGTPTETDTISEDNTSEATDSIEAIIKEYTAENNDERGETEKSDDAK